MTTNDSDGLARLKDVGAIITDDHIVYNSWRHGRAFVNIARGFNYNRLAIWFAEQAAPLLEHLKFETIVGPCNSDDKVAYAIAQEMYRRYKRELYEVYAQKKTRTVVPQGEDKPVEAIVEGEFTFPRQQADFVKNHRVVVVCDVLTTGKTLDGVIELTREAGGIILAVLVLCNRGKHHGTYKGFPLIQLMGIELEEWEEGPCPLCASGLPINTTVGHGRQYLERKSHGAGVVS